MTLRLLLVLTTLLAVPLTPVAADTTSTSDANIDKATTPWPQWRGPKRDGSVPGDDWPGSLDGLEKLWRVELGPSYSGPIVTAERVFTTATVDEEKEVVTALDRATGEVLWTREWSGSMKVPFFAAKNGSWIRATPAFDGERLFVAGMREVLVALDAETGEEVWRIDFPAVYETELPPFGFVCSPLVIGEHLYVEAAGSVFKLVAATGEVVWRTERFSSGDMTSEGTFSSPVLATIAGREQVLVQTRQALKGVAPQTGEVLWSQDVPSFRGMNILTPLVDGDTIFTSSSRNASWLYEVSTEGEGFTVSEKWRSKVHAYMSSPVLVDGVVYNHLGNGRLTAIDPATGESYWTTQSMGDYWSMAHQGDKILALNEAGELLLIEASTEAFRLLDQQNVASSPTWGHVAVSGEHVFVRELDGLSAWRWSETSAADTVDSGVTAAETSR